MSYFDNMYDDTQIPFDQDFGEDPRTDSQLGPDTLSALHITLLETRNAIARKKKDWNDINDLVDRQIKNKKELQSLCEGHNVKIDQMYKLKNIALAKHNETIKKCNEVHFNQLRVDNLLGVADSSCGKCAFIITRSKEHLQKLFEVESERRVVYQTDLQTIEEIGEGTLDQLQNFCEEIQKLLSIADKKLMEQKEIFQNINKELVNMDEQIEELHQNISYLQNEISDLEKEKMALNEKILFFKDLYSNECSMLEAEIQSIVDCIHSGESESEQERENLKKLAKEREEIKIKCEDVENQIKMKETEILDNSTVMEEKCHDLFQIKSELDEMRNSLNNMSYIPVKSHEKNQRIMWLKESNSMTVRELEDIKNKIADVMRNIEVSTLERNILVGELQSVNDHYKSLLENEMKISQQNEEVISNITILNQSLPELVSISKKLEEHELKNSNLEKVIHKDEETIRALKEDISKLMCSRTLKLASTHEEKEKIQKLDSIVAGIACEYDMEKNCLIMACSKAKEDTEAQLNHSKTIKEKSSLITSLEEELLRKAEKFSELKKIMNHDFSKQVEDKLNEFKNLQKKMEQDLEMKNEEFVNTREDYTTLRSEVDSLLKLQDKMNFQEKKIESEEIILEMFVKWIQEEESYYKSIQKESINSDSTTSTSEKTSDPEEDILVSDEEDDNIVISGVNEFVQLEGEKEQFLKKNNVSKNPNGKAVNYCILDYMAASGSSSATNF